MGLIDITNHLLNFLAPGLAVAVFTAFLADRLLLAKAVIPRFRVLALAGWVACTVVLVAGSWIFGRDGKMATYVGMVVVCATTQWVMARAWKA